jgi:hypothetical protein
MTLFVTYNLKWDADNISVINILLNIQTIINTYDIDFLLFQEARIYKKLINIIDNKKYNYHLNKSGEEHMITFYKKNYEKINAYDSDFSPGRPFCIFLFKNIISKNIFYLINLHSGHNINTELSIINPIEKITKYLNNETDIFILGGDFNRNIITSISIKTKNKNFKTKYFKNNSKTCCNTNNNKLKYNYDHILSSIKTIKKITFNKNIPSSDHILVIVELIDF